MADKTVFSPPAAQGSLRRGVRLNGLYELDTLIAHGGMGEVYRGFNVVTNDPVAIKLILPELSSNPEAFAMFKREASTLHNLQHEAIVRYFVFSVDPDLQRAYLAMEFVNGPPLSKSASNRPMTVEEVGILQRRLAGALYVAHQAGIIHRDISSENIILQDGDPRRAKIIDFGIARSLRATDGTIIGDSFAGKYNYASPEQLGLAGGEVTAKSDIYSLGLVLAEALRGRPLDMSGSQVEMIEKRRRIPDLSDIPASIRPLIAQMLQPLPADRPESMAAVAAWLPGGPRGRQAANDNSRAASILGRAAAVAAALIVIGSVGTTVYVFRDAIPLPQFASTAAKPPSPVSPPRPDSGAAPLPKLPPSPTDKPAPPPAPNTIEGQSAPTGAPSRPAAHPPTADELVDALNKARAHRQQSAELTPDRPAAEAPSAGPSTPSPANPAPATPPAATSSGANGPHSGEGAANPSPSSSHAATADDIVAALTRERARNKPAVDGATRPPAEAAPSPPPVEPSPKPAPTPPISASNTPEPKSSEASKPAPSLAHPLTADDIVAALARERARAKPPVAIPKPPTSETAPANQSEPSGSARPANSDQPISALGAGKPQDQPPVPAKPSTAEPTAPQPQPAANGPEASKNEAGSRPLPEPQPSAAKPPPLPPVEAPAPQPAKPPADAPNANERPAEIAAADTAHPTPPKEEPATPAAPPVAPLGDTLRPPEKPAAPVPAPTGDVAALDNRPAAAPPEPPVADATAAPAPSTEPQPHAPPPLPPPADAVAEPPLAPLSPPETPQKPNAEIMAATPPAAEAAPPDNRPAAIAPEPPKNDATAPPPAPHAAQSLVTLGGAVVGEDYAADLPPFSDAGDVKNLRLRAEPAPPPGLAFADLGSGFARLAGKPKEPGAYSFDIVASDGGAASARLTVKIAIAPAAAPIATAPASDDRAKLAAAEPIDKAAEFVRSFDGGSCFVARSMGANGPIPIILGVGADKQTFQRFYESFNRTVGVEPSLTARLIASSQCPAIRLIGAGALADPDAPKIELSNFDVGRNRPLAGQVSNLLGRSLTLLLVGSDGQVHRIETQPRANGASAAFNVPISASGADTAVMQVVIAIASPKPLPALVGFKAGAAADILPRVQSDLAAARGSLEAEFFRFVN